MAEAFRRLGADLALTRYVGDASAVPLETADSWGGLDLAVVPGGRGERPRRADLGDLELVSGRANLAQALILRLLTPRGGLAALGHESYGSRLGELIGRRNDETARNLARLYTLQALAEEPRIRPGGVVDLSVTTAPGQPETIRIAFSVLPIHDDEPLALGLEVAL
jgi:phage baseplate assembly protein W